jgi:putative ABC transport system permease protein
MNAFAFAWLSLVRQPARAALGVLGVAAVGALLFDMLLLSQGLVISMRDLFERAGFDLRVTATDALPGQGPQLSDGLALARAIGTLPEVRSSMALRAANAVIGIDSPRRARISFQGIGGTGVRPWTIVRGRDLNGPRDLVVNRNIARDLQLEAGSQVRIRAMCSDQPESLPPMTFTVSGVADFPFDTPYAGTAATSMDALDEACGGNEMGQADVIMVASAEGATSSAAANAIRSAHPGVRVLTNDELVGRFSAGGFSYFRQISTVLTTVTVGFAVLLITVLLTVSVNQRLGEIAALRALGFTRWRVVADVLCESVLIVGGGGLLSLPLGAALAVGLDGILKRIPGIPADVHFFVYRPEALGVHGALLAATALIAALYPVQVVARLPIAATLRNEVVG